MRKAVIDGETVDETPIRYRLVQYKDCVVLDAFVGDVHQSILSLYPHKITRVGWVSTDLGLKMEGTAVAAEIV